MMSASHYVTMVTLRTPDDRLPDEDEAVTAGQADGGAHRVVPAGHQPPVQRSPRHLTPGQLVT